MSAHEALINFIHREVERAVARHTQRTPVVVDGFDPKTHTAKFKLMPDSEDTAVITGWIPLQTQQTGNNFGWHMPPNIGDHGWLEFHDDDREAGNFVHASFNDQFQPVSSVQAGEWFYKHRSGSSIYYKSDGSVTITDKGGNTVVMNGTDTITFTAAKIVLNGECHLGGTGGVAAAMQGSVDSHGDSEISNLATKVFVQ
jgi:phage baseplate assembly protein gpV